MFIISSYWGGGGHLKFIVVLDAGKYSYYPSSLSPRSPVFFFCFTFSERLESASELDIPPLLLPWVIPEN